MGRFAQRRLALQPHAKAFVFEFEFREAVITQEPNQLAQFVHVDGRRGPFACVSLTRTIAPVRGITLFFGC